MSTIQKLSAGVRPTSVTTVAPPSGPVAKAGPTAAATEKPGATFERTSGEAALPAPRSNTRGMGNAVRAYFSSRTNVATASLSAAGVGITGAKLALRSVPVVGNLVNAASALISVAKACVRTAALLNHERNVDKADVMVDWARVATDVGGIFFPPIGAAGSVGAAAYTVYDVISDHQASKSEGTTTPA
ncbi:MAG: hypothetical protein AB2A00_06465 [Myxococcota bacterium]